MSRIAALEVNQAPEGSRPLLEGVKKALGMLPNVFKTLAHSPAVITGYMQFNDAMETSSLTPQERETISLAVSQVNGCEYCLSVHTFLGKRVGLSDDSMRSARTGELDAFAAFAHQIALTRGQVSDQELAAARAAGLSDAKIIEVVTQVALLTFTNLINNVARTTVDFPPVAL